MIRVEREHGVLSMSLNRPRQRNALSFALLAELKKAFSEDSLDGASAVILSGDGGIFSAGADFSELTGTSSDIAIDDAIEAVVVSIRSTSVPVIAWVDGPCIGGAVDIMLACDIRVASESAWFQVPATRLGLLYNPAAVARMHALLPRETLRRLLVQGARCDSGQALSAGLVTHAALGDSTVAEGSGSMRATRNVDAAVAATNELLDALDGGNFNPEEWQQRRQELLDSPERAAAISAAKSGQRG